MWLTKYYMKCHLFFSALLVERSEAVMLPDCVVLYIALWLVVTDAFRSSRLVIMIRESLPQYRSVVVSPNGLESLIDTEILKLLRSYPALQVFI